MKNKALVVIDLQNDITKNYKEIIVQVNNAIELAAENDMHIVYIKHNNVSEGTRTFKPGTRGEEFCIFIKENGITEFIVVGADATACVKSTCYNMTKAGYKVSVLSDCVTSYDKKKIDEMLNYYAGKGCTVCTFAEAAPLFE